MTLHVRGAAACAVSAAVVMVAGCSGGPSTEQGGSSSSTSSSTSSPSTSSSPSSSSSPRWSTSSGPDDSEMSDEPSAGASPTWDRASRADAVAAAEEVLTAFARPDLPQGQWWRDLGPMLTPTARETYRYVAVENVPIRKVRGKAKIIEDSSPYLATVEMKTDSGTYTVLLSRSEQGAPWLAERIEPERDSR